MILKLYRLLFLFAIFVSIENGKYKIQCLTAVTFPGALRVIRESFCQDETVCIGTEVNKNPQAAEELLELCADAALDGGSLVAVDISSGEVAAASFNKLQLSSSDSSEKPFFEIFAKERCTQASSRALIEFMAEVDSRCNFFEKYGVDCSLEIMFLATLQPHRGKGLGTLLCDASIELAKRLGAGPIAQMTLQDLGSKYSSMSPRAAITKVPKICQGIWTSEATQKIGVTLNFTVDLRISFKEFVYKGKSYVDRVGSEVFCEVAARPLE